MSNTVGQDTVVYLENGIKSRYFYGLRRTDEGTLYIGKVDQLQANDPVTINVPGAIVDNYEGFDQGEDFYEGRDLNHAKPFKNLKYEQFRWDDVNLNYYINDEGERVDIDGNLLNEDGIYVPTHEFEVDDKPKAKRKTTTRKKPVAATKEAEAETE